MDALTITVLGRFESNMLSPLPEECPREKEDDEQKNTLTGNKGK